MTHVGAFIKTRCFGPKGHPVWPSDRECLLPLRETFPDVVQGSSPDECALQRWRQCECFSDAFCFGRDSGKVGIEWNPLRFGCCEFVPVAVVIKQARRKSTGKPVHFFAGPAYFFGIAASICRKQDHHARANLFTADRYPFVSLVIPEVGGFRAFDKRAKPVRRDSTPLFTLKNRTDQSGLLKRFERFFGFIPIAPEDSDIGVGIATANPWADIGKATEGIRFR